MYAILSGTRTFQAFPPSVSLSLSRSQSLALLVHKQKLCCCYSLIFRFCFGVSVFVVVFRSLFHKFVCVHMLLLSSSSTPPSPSSASASSSFSRLLLFLSIVLFASKMFICLLVLLSLRVYIWSAFAFSGDVVVVVSLLWRSNFVIALYSSPSVFSHCRFHILFQLDFKPKQTNPKDIFMA